MNVDKVDRLIPEIARVAHEVNRAYCEAIGDTSQVPWEHAPQWQKDSAINGVTTQLHHKLTAEKQHEAWMEDKLKDGWKYGSVKDPAKKEHPCLKSYADLPAEQRIKDHLFIAVVESLRY